MSYSRDYHETIIVEGSESKTVNYPKSEEGGSMNVTVRYMERVPINIKINVDTSPFERSVISANRQVDFLTGSVVATEAAHIAAKVKSAEDISNTLVKGFYGLVKSEINQQIIEIKPRVEALIIELMHHSQSCFQKKFQLEQDFGRISERYTKIFYDLDKELQTRILFLNQSAVSVHESLTKCVRRSLSDISSSIATIYNKESNYLQSMLFASRLKSKALSLIESSKIYLFSEKNLSEQLKQILIPVGSGGEGIKKIPVLYFESRNQDNGNDVAIISSEQIPTLASNKTKLKDCFLNLESNWNIMDLNKREYINTYLKLQLSSLESETYSINPRIVQQIMQLWNNDKNIQTNN